MGLNTHWAYPSYASNSSKLQNILINSGVRHIRDEGNSLMPGVMKVLGPYNIKATLLIDEFHGVIPNQNYWSGNPPGTTYVIADFLKNYMPTGAVDAVEMANELDVFNYLYKWHPSDNNTLSTNPSSSEYYGAYGQAVTKDCWLAIKSDPTLASIKIIGPTVGMQVPSPYTPGSLYEYVDWGGFHTYPARANSWTFPQAYDTIQKYYWDSFEPSVNIATDTYGGTPLMFMWYQPAFSNGGNSKPMASTETGYHTALAPKGISVIAQGKYIPRLFAEYFRNGIIRTFVYELYDEGANATDPEQNYGLVYNDMTPKPAYTALASLIQLLAEPGAQFVPGTLNYSLAVQANGPYVRTGYVHDRLLEKSSGDFYLLLWHEISDTSDTDASGNSLTGEQRDIAPPALQTTIKLPVAISAATLYTYNSAWTLQPQDVVISNNAITISATDMLSIVRLSSQSSKSLSAPTGMKAVVH
jgi:hypothetical protein